jgi:HlyD family secretion protein
MSAPDRIFRQAALDRLSSPEQLDQLMQVTTPKSWMALAAFGFLILTALAWGIFGRIAYQVRGRGIFLKSEGVFLVAARGEGVVTDLPIRHGQVVTNGQLLARVSQPELLIRLRQAMTNLGGLQSSLQQLAEQQEREQTLEAQDVAAQQYLLETMLTNYSAQIAALVARTNVQSELYGRGLVSKSQYLDTQNSLYGAQHDLYRTRVQLQEAAMTQFQTQARRRQLKADREDQILVAQQQVESLSNLYVLKTEVYSPYSGEILEVLVKAGDLLAPNSPIASLQGSTNDLEARLFLRASDILVSKSRYAASSSV